MQKSHLAGFGQKIHRVFCFEKSCDRETVEECQITIGVSLCLEQKRSFISNVCLFVCVVFLRKHQNGNCAIFTHSGILDVTQQHFF